MSSRATLRDQERMQALGASIATAAEKMDDRGLLLGVLVGAAYALLRRGYGLDPEDALDRIDELASSIRKQDPKL